MRILGPPAKRLRQQRRVRRGLVQMFFHKLTGYRIKCIFEIAAANDARLVSALWIGMIRDPSRYAGIEAGTRRRRGILRQSIEGFRFRKNILNPGICPIELLRLELA
jgi:hypothetical protein